MNPKQLAQAIREGLNQSRGDLGSEINKALWTILGVMILATILLISWNQYYEWRYEKEFCGGNDCPITTVQAPDKCTLDRLDCTISIKSWDLCYQLVVEGYDTKIHETCENFSTETKSICSPPNSLLRVQFLFLIVLPIAQLKINNVSSKSF